MFLILSFYFIKRLNFKEYYKLYNQKDPFPEIKNKSQTILDMLNYRYDIFKRCLCFKMLNLLYHCFLIKLFIADAF